MSVQITTTHTLTSRPSDLTVEDLATFIVGLHPATRVTVRADYPDRPGGLGQITLTATPQAASQQPAAGIESGEGS